MIGFSYPASLAYELELRDSIDGALYRLELLRTAAKRSVELAERMAAELHGHEQPDPDTWAEKVQTQTRVFDELEAFLAAWARVSLLLFPVSKADFAKLRGAALQMELGQTESSPIANRDLRDAWMHHDERMDAIAQTGRVPLRQQFLMASEVTDSARERCLRLVELDTLKVHFHLRDGTLKTADLEELGRALQQLEVARRRAGAKRRSGQALPNEGLQQSAGAWMERPGAELS